MARVTKSDVLRSLYDYLSAQGADDLFLDYIAHEISMLSKPRKPTKTQEENVQHKNRIAAAVREYGDGVYASDIARRVNLSVQKTTALLTQLVKEDRIVRVEGVGKNKRAKFYA